MINLSLFMMNKKFLHPSCMILSPNHAHGQVI